MWASARAVIGLAVVILLVGRNARAQTPPVSEAVPTTKGVVLKNKAPVSDETLRVKLPRAQEVDLASGLHVMVLEDRRVPQVFFTLLIPGAGGYFDPADFPGLASFTASMMREGTTSRTSPQIAEQLETMAATLTVGTGMSSLDATLTGSSLTEHLDKLFALTAEVLLTPSFPDEELARYKQRTEAQLVQQRSSAGFLALEMFSRVIYGSHPAGRMSPTVESLRKANRAALADFHKSRYVPDHAAFAFSGDISLADARKLVEAKLGNWKKVGAPVPESGDPPASGRSKVHFVSRPNSVQTNLVVGTQAIDRRSPDYEVLQVLNKVIGGGPTGRLFLHLREDKGYTYGAYSGLSAGRFRGSWSASTEVRTDVTEPALRDLLAEVTRMRDEPVPDKEFRDQKRAMVASFALSLESPQQMLTYSITRWTYKLPADYWDRYPERIMAVTPAQVQAAAKKYLDPSRLQIVAVGDAGRITSILAGIGELETYDTDGKPVVKEK